MRDVSLNACKRACANVLSGRDANVPLEDNEIQALLGWIKREKSNPELHHDLKPPIDIPEGPCSPENRTLSRLVLC